MVTEHMCHRCGKVFTRKLHLERHLNRKLKCKYVNFDDEDEPEDGQFTVVSTDDMIINRDLEFEDLPEFNFLEKLEPDKCYSIILSAVRRSGKTTVIRWLYPFFLRTYDIVLFVSNSIHNPIYDFVTGPRFPDYNIQFFKDIFKFQRKTGNLFKILIITDDCVSMKRKNDNGLLQAFVRGRNSKISVVTSSQSTKLINKNNRQNADFVCIGNNPGEFRMDVIETFLMGANIKIPKFVKTKSQKLDYLNQFVLNYTKNYGFLIIDNIEHKVYKFRTPM